MILSVKNPPDQLRRRLVVGSLATAGTAALWTMSAGSRRSESRAADAQRVSPSEPLAKALGYTDKATAVDKSKFPTYMPGQGCDNCRFFQGKAGEAYGPCQIFMGKEVSINGWCASFAKKA
jgi:High potential iron-sulfur protein